MVALVIGSALLLVGLRLARSFVPFTLPPWAVKLAIYAALGIGALLLVARLPPPIGLALLGALLSVGVLVFTVWRLKATSAEREAQRKTLVAARRAVRHRAPPPAQVPRQPGAPIP